MRNYSKIHLSFINKTVLYGRKQQLLIAFLIALSLFLISSSTSFAGTESEQTIEQVVDAINNLWVLIAGILVLMMQLGFALIEAGFNAAKNTVNILFKNVIDACIGILIYFAFGYALMYRPETGSVWQGFPGWLEFSLPYTFLHELVPRKGAEHLSSYIDFFFQAAFVATATTICSGAVAGRIKPLAYLLLTILITGLVYPISGYWVWGGGWLAAKNFHDFAGSLVVHSVGGSAGLASVFVLGSRKGKFDKSHSELSETETNELLAHSLPLATMGMFILWIGWYGFNAGSALGIAGDISSPNLVGRIALNTTISACTSAVTVMLWRWSYRWRGKHSQINLSYILNGVLGGLVGITASCDIVSPVQSIFIGLVSGLVVIGGIRLLYECKVDDAVEAFPVHALCGIWGGLASGIFVETIDISTQLLGSLIIPLWSGVSVYIVFRIMSTLIEVRVSEDEEKEGLDYLEHGEYSYLNLQKEENRQ